MEDLKMKELINRLVEWLESKGFTDTEIKECIKYITK
jgi:hypothetical protein